MSVYVNTGNQRSSNGYRGSAIYDDVQAQRDGLVCKEPPYDNHIVVQALRRGESDTCPLKHTEKIPQPTSSGNRSNIEDLYSKPTTFKRKADDDGYDSSHRTRSVPLQEGENLLVENELYNTKPT